MKAVSLLCEPRRSTEISARVTLLDPNILRLAGDLQGKKVLDAGCGNGYLSRKLAKLGAIVTGIEPSKNLYQYCIKSEQEDPLGVAYTHRDLDNIELTEKYDLVVLINVLMDIPEYQIALENCIKTLRPGGEIITSILHPCFPGSESEWESMGYVQVKEYFVAPPVKQKYGYFITRPIQDYFNGLIENGCTIQEVVEPRQAGDARNAHVPQFLMIKAQKR